MPEPRVVFSERDYRAALAARAAKTIGRLPPPTAAPSDNGREPGTPRETLESGSEVICSWPDPPADAAYSGILGELVAAIAPHSEADPVALLTHGLVMFGNAVGRGPYVRVEADQHYVNENTLQIGQTSKARKGTALGRDRLVFKRADPEWDLQNIKAGLSSGEGLIHHVRDPLTRKEPLKEAGKVIGQQTVLVDEGVTDKRLLVIETEFAGTLSVMAREGNTLSPTIRQAWDTGTLRTLTKTTPEQATDAHISIIGHVTAEELRTRLDRTEVANGFLNRFLLVCVRRSQCLPEGGTVREQELAPIIDGIRKALQSGRLTEELTRDRAARELWADVYPDLSEGQPGLLGAATSRAEAHVVRLSALYALLAQSPVIGKPHLEAALALWRYCEASARFVFGDTLADPLAERLYALLMAHPEGVTRSEIYDHFDRHQTAKDIAHALGALARQGRAERLDPEPTGGRPVERWVARKAQKARKGATEGVAEGLNALNAHPRGSRFALPPPLLNAPRGDAWEPEP